MPKHRTSWVYFLKSSELFSELARRGNGDGKSKFILGDLDKVLTNIEQSTLGAESEEDLHSSPILDKPEGTIKINKILIGICIGGIIVYIFRDDIDDFFRKLLNNKSSDDIIIS